MDDTGIYASGDNAIGEMYADSDFTAGVTIDGGGTVGLASVKLTVASGQRHLGVENGGVRILGGIELEANIGNFTLEYIELNGNDSAPANFDHPLDFFTSDAGNVVRYNIIHNFITTNIMAGIKTRGNCKTHNNWVYNMATQQTGGQALYGIVGSGGSGYEIYNNSVHDIRQEVSNPGGGTIACIEVTGSASATMKNNIATDASASDPDVATILDYKGEESGVTENNNAASDTSISGTDDLTSLASSSQYVSNASPYDLSVKDSNADIVDAGVDLGTTPTGVNIDIKGRDRDTQGDTWDIGAHEGFNIRRIIMVM